MMLRLLRIEHFRGIESVTWKIDRHLIGLIGAGDSTKTTLLDAIGLVLSPTNYLQFTDADFFSLNLTRDIVIEAVVTDLPDNLVKESQLGKDRSGILPDGTLVHDPIDQAEECLVIRLTVNPELDPVWEVIRPASDDARPISASQRRQLGFFRLGERPDSHLRWGRGSALMGMTDGGDGLTSIILDAHREARQAVFNNASNVMHHAATRVQASAGSLGTPQFKKLRPGLEPWSATSGHALVLHDGEVPLTRMGLGTRRLTSLSIQDQAMTQGSIIAIDEIEHGLEPHRLAQVLYYLKNRTDEGKLQVILTTHSPVAVKTLSAADFVVVGSDGAGTTTCRHVPEDLNNVQGTFRSAPDALLGRRVLVGEGATEVGFLRELIRHWDEVQHHNGHATAAAIGTVLVDGGGGVQSTGRAMSFHQLGYPTHLLVDNDDDAINPYLGELRDQGIQVHQWSADHDLEREVITTLRLDGLQELLELAVEFRGEESVCAAVGAKLGHQSLSGIDISQWLAQTNDDESKLRDAIAAAAVVKGKEWFKRQDRGEDLAAVTVKHWAGLDDTHLMRVLNELQNFVYDRPSELKADNERHSIGD